MHLQEPVIGKNMEDLLSLALQTAVVTQGLSMTHAANLVEADQLKSNLNALVASIAGLKSAQEIALWVFMPELCGFQSVYQNSDTEVKEAMQKVGS